MAATLRSLCSVTLIAGARNTSQISPTNDQRHRRECEPGGASPTSEDESGTGTPAKVVRRSRASSSYPDVHCAGFIVGADPGWSCRRSQVVGVVAAGSDARGHQG